MEPAPHTENKAEDALTPRELWSAPLGGSPGQTPIVAGDLALLATQDPDPESDRVTLHALDLADATPRWQVSFAHTLVSGLAATGDGLILVTLTSTDLMRGEGALVALEPTGEERYRWTPGVQRLSAPALSDDLICLTADARTLVTLDPASGEERSSTELVASASSSAPRLAGDVAYVPCRGPHLLAMGLDGQLRWRFDAAALSPAESGAWLDRCPVVAAGHLFAVLTTGALLALRTADGALAWRAQVGPAGKPLTAPVADGERIFVGARDGLYGLDVADGRTVFHFPTPRRFVAAPVLHAGVLYAACHDHHLYAVDARTGQELWRVELARRFEVSPVLASCGEPPTHIILVADRTGTLTALARPLTAHDAATLVAAGRFHEATALYVELGQPDRAAQTLEDHDLPRQAAEMWEEAGQRERAARQYEAAEAWERAVDLWAALDRPLKQAQALVAHARSLGDDACTTEERVTLWQTAARLFESEGEGEQASTCHDELARLLHQPIITLDAQHEGLLLNTWTRLNFTVRNEGYGPARNLVIRAEGEQFKGEVMHTQKIITLRPGQENTEQLSVCPLQPGDYVPLRVVVDYEDDAGQLHTCKHTIHLDVARTEAARSQPESFSVLGRARQAKSGPREELASLQRQLIEERSDLRLIQERKSQYVMETAIPLDLIKQERRTLARITDLEEQIRELESRLAHLERPPAPAADQDIESRKIKILFLAANPLDTTTLRLDEEIRSIDQALRQAEFRERFDIRQHWAVRVGDIQELLLRHRPDIVHFSGHGSESSEIILQDSAGKGHVVPAGGLSDLFSVLKDNIRCVVLNACYTEAQAAAVARHIDCVVGMSRAFTDTAAISFATAFYRALGYGRDVESAFKLGCIEINLEDLGEQDTPTLLTETTDAKTIIFV